MRTAEQQAKRDRSPVRSGSAGRKPERPQASTRSTGLARALGNRAFGQVLQPRLRVDAPDDRYEREAERVADAVMRMSEPKAQRAFACGGEGSGCRDIARHAVDGEVAGAGPDLSRRKGAGPRGAEATVATSTVHGVLRSPGQPLEPGVASEMQARFGRDFSSVRVHTDTRAAQSARAVNARAYTVGADVVFGEGEYAPHSISGRRLLAHELTHVLQQGGGRTGEPLIQRQERTATPDTRPEDPGFLLCMTLCYLGVPTPVWKRAVDLLMRAAWEEYGARYADRNRALEEFRSFKAGVRAYGTLNLLRLVLTFAVEGKIALVPIRTAGARALQQRLRTFLITRGVSMASMATGLQMLRKGTVVIELAWTAGCGAYCGSMAYARTIMEATDALARGVVAGVRTVEAVGGAIHGFAELVFLRPVYVARATLDPLNWDLGAMPARDAEQLTVLGLYLWREMQPDDPDRLMENLNRRLGSFPIPPEMIRDIARAIEGAMNARGSLQRSVPPELLWKLSVIGFVHFLRDWGVLRFRRDPQEVADEALYGPAVD
jgi:hypothetical protein